MNRRRILLVIPEMITGGAQRSIAKLSIELSHDHQIWLVVFNKNSEIAYPFGGELLSLDVVPGKYWISKIFSLYQRVMRLRAIKRKLKIEVALSFLEGADYVNILSRVKEKIILCVRGSKIHDEIMLGSYFWLRRKVLIPFLYRKADLITTVNNGIANELILDYRISKKKILTIYNFYDLDEIDRLSMELKTHELLTMYQNPILITSGRLSREKGLKEIIKIFSILKRRENLAKLKLIIVGDGPMQNQLINLCNKLTLQVRLGSLPAEATDIIFTGNQSNVFRFLSGATLYLSNSSSEGFPNGMVEAMACGVPVMSSNCPYGPAEILAPNDKFISTPYQTPFGILMPIAVNDLELEIWADSIQSLLNNEMMRKMLSLNARARVKDFNKEKIVSLWMKAIHE